MTLKNRKIIGVDRLEHRELNKWSLQKLKDWAIKLNNLSSKFKNWRYYYGEKYVVEGEIDTQLDFWMYFWDFWRVKKEEIKACGFGIIKQYERWILFCEIKYIPEFEKAVQEEEEERLKPSKISSLLKERKLSKNDAIYQLELYIQQGNFKNIDELLNGLDMYLELTSIGQDQYIFLEELAISDKYSQIKMKVMVYLAKHYLEESRSLIRHILDTDERIVYFFMYYYSKEDRNIIGSLLEESLLKRVLTRELKETTWKNYLRKYYKTLEREKPIND